MATISSLGIGSGLDLNGLLDQLEEAERGKLEPIERQLETQQTKISAYGQLQSSLSQFQTASAALNDSALYESLSTNVGGSAVSAAAGADAQPGSYNVTVDQLATAGTLATTSVADPTTALTEEDTTFTLQFAGDDHADVPVHIAAGSTLEDVRDAINAQEESGVSASIIFDGEEYRLALNSTETGKDASISGIELGAGFNGQLTADVVQEGNDAMLNVNGITITSPTNQVEGAIQGVTLSLQEEGSSTIAVEQDTRAVREAITNFVDAYNALKGTVGELTSFNPETGEAGELIGDSATRTVETRLRSVLSSSVEGEISMLSDIGISLQRDGTLAIDESELDNAIANNQEALSTFFAGDSSEAGMAGQMSLTVEQLLSPTGAVTGAITGAEDRSEALVERYARMEQSIDQTISRYRTQFGQLDSMIAQMNQTSDYLTQQFDALDAQLGRR